MPVRPRPPDSPQSGSDGGGGSSSTEEGGRPSKKRAAPLPPALPAVTEAAAATAAAVPTAAALAGDDANPAPVAPPLPPAIGMEVEAAATAASAAAAAAPASSASPLDRPHACNPPKQPTARTIVVAGMSPASFKDELLRIWPKRPNRKVRMVWINTHDPPPPLPDGWAWHEEHRCSAEALWEEVEAEATGPGAAGGVVERWEGQPLFVIMGAGTSVQDFTQLKVAQGACYPFDKELLQASVEVDVVDPERIVVLSDSSSESDSGYDSDSDADEVENMRPKAEEEGEEGEEGEGKAAAQKPRDEGQGAGAAQRRGEVKGKVKEERPPPAPLSPGRTPVQEPLCMQTLRFMASLRRAYLERRLPGFHRWLASQQHRLAGVLTFNIDSLEFLALDPSLHGRVLQFHGNINQLTTIDALSQPYKTRPSVGPGGCPRVWYDPEALGRVAAGCPDTARLVDVALEEASGVYLGSSSSSGDGGGGSGGLDLSLRPPRPRRQTSALLSDAGAMDEVCRKLGRGLPLAAPGLSSGELSKINAHFRARIRGMYLGNCVFTGEANDARLARAAQTYLRTFVHEAASAPSLVAGPNGNGNGNGSGAGAGAGKGEAVFARLEREVAEINAGRGVLPPAEEAALFAAMGAPLPGALGAPGAVVEVERKEETRTVAVTDVVGEGAGDGNGEGVVTRTVEVVTTTTTTTTTMVMTMTVESGAEAEAAVAAVGAFGGEAMEEMEGVVDAEPNPPLRGEERTGAVASERGGRPFF